MFRAELSRRSVTSFVVGFLMGVCLLGASFELFKNTNAVPAAKEITDHDARMKACISSTLEIAKPAKMNVGVYERLLRLCGNEIFNALYLDDFRVRNEKFVRQYLDERVTLWMVVIITISGVVLAAIQLFMSFRLAIKGRAEFGKDNEVALESGKLSLKSSITGAVILALSFAFFMVYVIWIYTIHEVPVGRPDNLQSPVEIAPNENSSQMNQQKTKPAKIVSPAEPSDPTLGT